LLMWAREKTDTPFPAETEDVFVKEVAATPLAQRAAALKRYANLRIPASYWNDPEHIETVDPSKLSLRERMQCLVAASSWLRSSKQKEIDEVMEATSVEDKPRNTRGGFSFKDGMRVNCWLIKKLREGKDEVAELARVLKLGQDSEE
jgi:hypothetical protein